jgi:YjbE family integral membrane protein
VPPRVSAILDAGALGALLSVVLIDLTLAGDNAIVIGLAAGGLPPALRRRAMWLGIGAATLLRIALAFVAVDLLAILGLTLAGGLILLWVAWKLYRDWRAGRDSAPAAAPLPAGGLGRAILRLVLADISMSLDNVLAVAGAARGHVWVLIAGLALSVGLMGLASSLMIALLARHRWLAFVGIAIVAFVALRMIYEGSAEIVARLPLNAF